MDPITMMGMMGAALWLIANNSRRGGGGAPSSTVLRR